MTPKKRLGRGLDALLSKPAQAPQTESTSLPSDDGLTLIPVEHLQRGQYQPRVDIRQDSLEELADSIRAQGVVQPIVARPIAKKGGVQRYEIIAGERRWRAAQMAQIHEVPIVVREFGDLEVLEVAIIENIQRENRFCIFNAISVAIELRAVYGGIATNGDFMGSRKIKLCKTRIATVALDVNTKKENGPNVSIHSQHRVCTRI